MMDYLTLPIKEKIIFIWIRHLRFEFLDYDHWRGYNNVINDIINPIEIGFMHKQYEGLIELCKEGVDTVKLLNGNHYHMNLFIELEKLLREL